MSISTSNAPAGTGYVGSLNDDQTRALKKLWVALFEILANGTVTLIADLPTTPVAVATPAPAASSWGGGWFTAAPAAPVEPVIEPPTTVSLQEIGITAEQVQTVLENNILGDHPDSLVLRFLRARKFHVANGLIMLLNAFKFRLDQNVEDVKVLGEDELEEIYPKFKLQLESGKMLIHGTDKNGSPIVYVNVGLHRPGEADNKTMERLTLYLMETGRLLINPPTETVILVFDLSQFGLANMDYNLVKFLVQCFQTIYPESLASIYIHKSPFVFWGVWKIIEPWLDPVVAAKIKFTSTDAELLEYIPENHLLSSYEGGKDLYQYKYLEPIAGENDLMKDTKTKNERVAEWRLIWEKYQRETEVWINATEQDNVSTLEANRQRNQLAKDMRVAYFKASPYIRARNMFNRGSHPAIQPNGEAHWVYEN